MIMMKIIPVLEAVSVPLTDSQPIRLEISKWIDAFL